MASLLIDDTSVSVSLSAAEKIEANECLPICTLVQMRPMAARRARESRLSVRWVSPCGTEPGNFAEFAVSGRESAADNFGFIAGCCAVGGAVAIWVCTS